MLHHYGHLKYPLTPGQSVQGNTFARELATVLGRPVMIQWPNVGGPRGNVRTYTTAATPLVPFPLPAAVILWAHTCGGRQWLRDWQKGQVCLNHFVPAQLGYDPNLIYPAVDDWTPADIALAVQRRQAALRAEGAWNSTGTAPPTLTSQVGHTAIDEPYQPKAGLHVHRVQKMQAPAPRVPIMHPLQPYTRKRPPHQDAMGLTKPNSAGVPIPELCAHARGQEAPYPRGKRLYTGHHGGNRSPKGTQDDPEPSPAREVTQPDTSPVGTHDRDANAPRLKPTVPTTPLQGHPSPQEHLGRYPCQTPPPS